MTPAQLGEQALSVEVAGAHSALVGSAGPALGSGSVAKAAVGLDPAASEEDAIGQLDRVLDAIEAEPQAVQGELGELEGAPKILTSWTHETGVVDVVGLAPSSKESLRSST